MRKKTDKPTAIVVRPRPSIWLRLFAWAIAGSKADFIAEAENERTLRIKSDAEIVRLYASLQHATGALEQLQKEHVRALATLRLVAFGLAHGMTHQQARDRGLIPHYEDPVDARVIA